MLKYSILKEANKSVQIIAEIGLNHAGSLQRAKALSLLAYKNGADCIKHQFFTPEYLINEKSFSKAIKNPSFSLSNFKKLILTDDDIFSLLRWHEEIKIPYGISFFSRRDFTRLNQHRNILSLPMFSFFKIASSEITNLPLLCLLDTINKSHPFIIACGAADDDEIASAVSSIKAKKALLHCIVEYPITSYAVNIRRIPYLKNKFNLQTGFSDHSIGITLDVLAINNGATIIEKHFTDSRKNMEADNPISVEPQELKELSSLIRHFSAVMGTGAFAFTDKEAKEIFLSRKGLYCNNSIDKGQVITDSDIAIQRPSFNENSIIHYYSVLNKKARKMIQKNEAITLEKINTENFKQK